MPLPPRSPAPLDTAPWWAEFLAVKDGLSWGALAHRFGVNGTHLQRALAEAGLTKKAVPPGRKPKVAGPGAPAPVASTAPDPVLTTAEPIAASPESMLRRQAGKRPDGEVAEAAGVSPEDVKNFRRAHGIAAYLRPPPGMSMPVLPPAAPVQSAPAPGDVIVRRTSAPGQPVQEVRRAVVSPTGAPVVAEPPSTPPPARSVGLERFRAELGTVGDHVIAERAGVSIGNVAKFRRDHGIPAYDGFRRGPRQKRPALVVPEQAAPPVERPAPEQQPPPAGRRSALDADAEPAPETTPPAAEPREPEAMKPQVAPGTPTPGRTSKIEPFAELVGVLPDRTIARRAGTTVGSVQVWRSRRGIPAPARSPRDDGQSVATDEIASGMVPGPVVAAPDLPVASPARPDAPPAPPAPPAPLAPVDPEQAASRSGPDLADVEVPADPDLPSATAYRLRATRGAEIRDFFIVADDIGDAGVRAIAALSRAGGRPWRVVAIRELGEALE